MSRQKPSIPSRFREELPDLRRRVYMDEWEDRLDPGFSDARDSYLPVWISLPPFLIGEYFVELTQPWAPSGLVFPFGFLLFWAFYYSFYHPNVLEDHLSDPIRWKFSFDPRLPGLFLLWFVTATLLEIRYLVVSLFIPDAPAKIEQPKSEPRPQQAKAQEIPIQAPQSATASRFNPAQMRALGVLGLDPSTDIKWVDVQKRFRLLAKKYHPDVNQTGTQGRRFIEVDQAYRTLEKSKTLFS